MSIAPLPLLYATRTSFLSRLRADIHFLQGRRAIRQLDYVPPMHRHPLSIMKSSTSLKKLVQQVSHVSPERQADERFQKIIYNYNGANALKLIHRFIDKRQPHLRDYPQRVDESDIWSANINPQKSDILVYERRFQRLWILFLHRKGLHRFEERQPSGIKQNATVGRSLYDIYMAGRLVLKKRSNQNG